MRRRRKESLLVLAALLTLASAIAGGCTTATGSPGQIELSAREFDLGTVPNTGPATHVFQVRNVGRGELEITGVSTSCGCTTAEVEDRNLAPGETTDLRVTYDPQVHGGETGKFLRVVYVRSDDPDTPEASLTIQVTVVEPDESPGARGGFRRGISMAPDDPVRARVDVEGPLQGWERLHPGNRKPLLLCCPSSWVTRPSGSEESQQVARAFV